LCCTLNFLRKMAVCCSSPFAFFFSMLLLVI
jgi:hypothetical protein